MPRPKPTPGPKVASAELLDACHEDDDETVAAALDAGVSPDARDGEDESLLGAACHSDGPGGDGATGVVRLLLKRGADVNALTMGYTPLMLAASCAPWAWDGEASMGGRPRVVELLLKAKADVNARGDEGSTALHHAAQVGAIACVKLLLAAGADREARDDDDKTAADEASEWNSREHEDIVELLRGPISLGDAKPAPAARKGVTLSLAPAKPPKPATAAAAAAKPKKPKKPKSPAAILEALYDAATDGDVAETRRLLAAGAPADGIWDDCTMLQQVVVNTADPRVIDALFTYGARDVAPPNSETGMNALMLAAGLGKDEAVEALVRGGSDLAAKDHDGETALHFAVRKGEPEAARILVEAGADPRAKDSQGRTPIKRAEGDDEMEKLLRGAKPRGKGSAAAGLPPRPASSLTIDDGRALGDDTLVLRTTGAIAGGLAAQSIVALPDRPWTVLTLRNAAAIDGHYHVAVFDHAAGRAIAIAQNHEDDRLDPIAAGPGGSFATWSDRWVVLWQADGAKLVHRRVRTPVDELTGVVFAGAHALAWGEGQIFVIDPARGTIVHTIAIKYLGAVLAAPDGGALAIGDDHVWRLDLAKGSAKKLKTSAKAAAGDTCALAPDGHTLVSASRRGDNGWTVTVLDLDGGAPPTRIDLGVDWSEPPHRVVVSADNRRALVTGDFDRGAALVDLRAGRVLAIFPDAHGVGFVDDTRVAWWTTPFSKRNEPLHLLVDDPVVPTRAFAELCARSTTNIRGQWAMTTAPDGSLIAAVPDGKTLALRVWRAATRS